MTSTRKQPLRLERPSKGFARLGLGRSTGYKQIQDGLLPKPVAIGERARALVEHEIDMVIRARIAGQSDDEIRQLVRRIEAERAGPNSDHALSEITRTDGSE